MLHALVAVEAEISYVTAMLRMHLRNAEQDGDDETIAMIRRLMTA
ncbi:MAG: hypothetical protein ACLGIN_15500 [Candidatus Sericytochromatia bacterium]